MIDKETISNVIHKIAENANPDKIFLFGSYATGTATEDSDIDLLVVKDSNEPRYMRNIEIQRLLIGSKLPVDVLVYTNHEFVKEKLSDYSFLSSVIKEAQLMYERE